MEGTNYFEKACYIYDYPGVYVTEVLLSLEHARLFSLINIGYLILKVMNNHGRSAAFNQLLTPSTPIESSISCNDTTRCSITP